MSNGMTVNAAFYVQVLLPVKSRNARTSTITKNWKLHHDIRVADAPN